MHRLLCVAALAACAVAPDADTSTILDASTVVSRDHVTADIYHYTFDLRVGSTPNAIVRVHRVVRELSPWRPRPTHHAIALTHGDFSTFVTNFLPTQGDPASSAPGLAPYLVARGIDVWGIDRRWTIPATDGDISDIAGMSVDQAIGDLELALGFARATRAITDGDPGRILLGGFSHGAEVVYAYAAGNGHHISGLVPIDINFDFAPADEALHEQACEFAEFDRELLDGGLVDSDNSFVISAGELDRSAPDDPSPNNPAKTNRAVMYNLLGRTYNLAPFTPTYHLLAPVLDAGGTVTALRESTEDAASAWLAGSPFHQAMREATDLDEIWCGDFPGRAPLSNIHVPVFYLGAAGGFGDLGLYSTTQVSSHDVTTVVVRRFGPDCIAEDFGHGDLLYATDAPALAWAPLASWILHH